MYETCVAVSCAHGRSCVCARRIAGDILAALGDDGDYDDVSDAGSRSGTYALDGGVSAAIVPADEVPCDAMSPRSSTSSSRTDDAQLARQGVDGSGVRARAGGPYAGSLPRAMTCLLTISVVSLQNRGD